MLDSITEKKNRKYNNIFFKLLKLKQATLNKKQKVESHENSKEMNINLKKQS